MKIRENQLWICLPALLLAAGSAFASVQLVTECGAILTEPGNYHLKNDLVGCPYFGIAITGSGIMLDFKGHQVACADGDDSTFGLVVFGTGETAVRNVTVRNGHVSNCSEGIVLQFVEDSKITHMTSSGNRIWEGVFGEGLTVLQSHDNVIMRNHVFGNESHGIGSIESSGNVFKHNVSTDNGDGIFQGVGIGVQATTDSLFVCNRTNDNVDGIVLAPGSANNLIQGNEASGNVGGGIYALGYAWDGFLWQPIPGGNTVKQNIVENNGWFDVWELYFDLVTEDIFADPGGTCMNAWEKNRYVTEFGPPGCFGVSFDLEDICAYDDD